jgi:serine protease DegQ
MRVWSLTLLILLGSMYVTQSHSQSVHQLDVHASGVFLNQSGDVLTASHAVQECGMLYVVKDGHVKEAKVIAMDRDQDIAVLATTLKPYLHATLPQSSLDFSKNITVFSESYEQLRRLPNRASLLSNAITISGDSLQLISGVKPGASGSAVLDKSGLLLGIITERIMRGTQPAPATTIGKMSSRASMGPAGTGEIRVQAADANGLKQFLRQHHIVFDESDLPQLGAMQSPAARAATLAVGVICG